MKFHIILFTDEARQLLPLEKYYKGLGLKEFF